MKSCFTLLVILQIFLDVSSLNLVLDRDINGLKELMSCRYNMCGLNGFCEIKFGEEVCVCKKGFIGKNCQLNDPCDSKYSACNNNGECYSIIQLVNDVEEANFYCHCRAGYSGRNCEMVASPCTSNPCFNSGICVNRVNSKNEADFTCICMNGYVGTTCGAYVGPCYYNECQNDAKCVEKPNNQYSCECKPGFYGNLCEFEINECIVKRNGLVTSPCQNNGKCFDRINSYFCDCEGPYTGKNCEKYVNPCESGPCKNGSYCVPHENSYLCPCSKGFYGTKCLPNPCLKNPCKSQSSTCIPVDSHVGYDGINDLSIPLEQRDLFVCVCANSNQEYVGPAC